MRALEKYSRSLTSTNLKDDGLHHNTAMLSAVALSAPHGSSMFRAKLEMDRNSLEAFSRRWVGMVTRRAHRFGWSQHAVRVARISLWHWLDPLCKTCNGKGKMTVRETGAIDHKFVCQSCGGLGHRRIKCDAEIKPHVTDSISILNAMMYEVGAKARQKLY